MKTCESCGSPNPPAAAFCQQCATPLIDVAPGTARLVATFGPSTGWVGKKVTRDGDHFVLEDHGPISASDVMSYDRQGHLVWASDGARAWVASLAQPKPTAGSFSIAVDSAVQSAKAALASPRPTVTTPDGAPSSATHTAAAQTTPGSPAHAAPASAPAMSAADEITKLADLHSRGSLTDEEFAALKAKLDCRGRWPRHLEGLPPGTTSSPCVGIQSARSAILLHMAAILPCDTSS